jgi:hypothetical protein
VYRYIDDFPLEKDETFQRIMNRLSSFLDNISSKEDKELLLRMVKEAYFKHSKSIKTNADSNTELMLSTIMALLMEHNKEIKMVDVLTKTRKINSLF